jgi:carbon storage regulator
LLGHIGFFVRDCQIETPMRVNNTQKPRANLKHKEGNMLVLSRKPTERIHIGDSVVITVLEVRGNRTRLGIDAPEDIHVLRGELQERVSRATGKGSGMTVKSAESHDPRNVETLKADGPGSWATIDVEPD